MSEPAAIDAPAPAAEPVAAPESNGQGGQAPVTPTESPSDNSSSLIDVQTQDDGKSWIEAFPESTHNNPNFTKYDSIEAFVKGHESAVSMIGKKALERPTAESTDEQHAEWRNHIGAPSESSQYTLPESITGMSDDAKSNVFGESGPQGLFEAFHKSGMTQEQVNGVFQTMDSLSLQIGENYQKHQEQSQIQEKNATSLKLKQEWGSNTKSNLKEIARVAEDLGITQSINNLGLGNNLEHIMMLKKVVDSFKESSADGTNGNYNGESKLDAQTRLNKDFKDRKIDKTEYTKQWNALINKHK